MEQVRHGNLTACVISTLPVAVEECEHRELCSQQAVRIHHSNQRLRAPERKTFAVSDLSICKAQDCTLSPLLLHGRLDELEAEQQRLQDPVPEPEAVESSCDEQISSMSESSAGSSDRNRHPMSVASTHSSMDEEEESGHQLNGHLDDTMYHFRESDAASLSGDSADSSITTASVAVEPLMGYMELVEEVGISATLWSAR